MAERVSGVSDLVHPRTQVGKSPLTQWLSWLGRLLSEELAPSPRRIKTSLRKTTIATIAAGLMAACHVTNPLGPYVVWVMLGSSLMMSPARAVGYLIITGIVLAAADPLAGILAESPWLMLPFIGIFTAIITYESTIRKLGPIGLVWEVVTLDTLYGVVFDPRNFGWSDSALFGGCALGFATIAAFDTWIWPNPAEAILLESLAASLEGMRMRFVKASAYYLDETNAERPQEPPATSEMPGQLTLLDSVVAEGATESRHKVLVAVISIIERLHIRVGRIDILAREMVARTVRIMVRSEMATACAEIAAALAEFARDLSVVIRSSENRPPAPNAASARAAIDALNARIIKVRPQYIRVAGGAEIANFAAFGENLQAMLRLLERPIDVTSATEPMPPPIAAPSDSVDPALLRYCLKVGLCVVVGYIVGLTTQRADLSTILTTIIITALTTYGASLRKTILRMVGALLGGVLSLLMIIVVSPNFATLPTYMFATFAVLFISVYSGMSGRVAYAGNHIGTTYFLVVVGLSPPLDIYSPLWRVWGTLLGTIVVTVVFFIIWPEYAGDSLLPRLRRVLTDTLALMPGGSSTSTVGAIDATSNEITQILSEILQVAEDARLEGRKSLIDHDSVVSSMGTIRRIASRIASFARLSISEVLPRLDDATEAAKDAVFLAMRRRMEAWIAFYGGTRLTSAAALALAGRHSRSEIAKPLEEFATRIEADGFARIAGWTLDQRRHTMGALESFRRIEFLMFELDAYLSHVLGGGPAIVFSDTEDGATPPSA